jgi:hypothetical protein
MQSRSINALIGNRYPLLRASDRLLACRQRSSRRYPLALAGTSRRSGDKAGIGGETPANGFAGCCCTSRGIHCCTKRASAACADCPRSRAAGTADTVAGNTSDARHRRRRTSASWRTPRRHGQRCRRLWANGRCCTISLCSWVRRDQARVGNTRISSCYSSQNFFLKQFRSVTLWIVNVSFPTTFYP